MRSHDGTHYAVTPSVLFADDSVLLGVDAGEGGFIHLRRDGLEFDGEAHVDHFEYRIFGTDSELMYASGMNAPTGLPDRSPLQTLHALLSFLTACAEANDADDENYDLFPSDVREWADTYYDELVSISVEIEDEIE